MGDLNNITVNKYSIRIPKTLILVFVIMVFYIFLGVIGVGCPIKFITGISCLGCGMTRAWISIIHLDFGQAFYYHPLFFLPPLFIVIYYFKDKINPKIYKGVLLTIIGLFVIVYIYRIIFGDGVIVVFNPENNIVFRLLNSLS